MSSTIYQEATMSTATRPERRKGPDQLLKIISYFSRTTWILILIAFIIFTYAQPRTPTMFERKSGMMGNQTWDKTFLGYIAIALALTAIVCFTGLAVNSIRHRRRSDNYNRSLLIFGVGSVIGIIAYFIFA
jgi:hypothetical protein